MLEKLLESSNHIKIRQIIMTSFMAESLELLKLGITFLRVHSQS
jgi:hypothetical protein